MNLDDEIRIEAEKLRKIERQDDLYVAHRRALREARMDEKTPVLIEPPPELKPIIVEMLPKMQFDCPKIVRSMPDGCTYVRKAVIEKSEEFDIYSFDVLLSENFSSLNARSSPLELYLWIFENGMICFTSTLDRDRYFNELWSKRWSIKSDVIRSKIIRELANRTIQNSNYDDLASLSESVPSKQSKGCYIATSIYGSYDCPEVCVLRRYRDNILLHNFFGRLFVKIYYAISPTLIKVIGDKKLFSFLGHSILDRVVTMLKIKGFSDRAYNDQN